MLCVKNVQIFREARPREDHLGDFATPGTLDSVMIAELCFWSCAGQRTGGWGDWGWSAGRATAGRRECCMILWETLVMRRCVLQNVACSVFVSTTNSNKKKEDNMIVLHIIRTMYDTLGVWAGCVCYKYHILLDNKWRVVSATNIANISIPLHSLINTASVFTADYAMRTD